MHFLGSKIEQLTYREAGKVVIDGMNMFLGLDILLDFGMGMRLSHTSRLWYQTSKMKITMSA